ncbi:hypothetical protein H4219_001076 [Mycoemilia scoparia]|uniref:Uncharacterized protein n=1 Tax=Mycoemilia scoparia TaxID=417184 RepID=A0A9W8DVW0_9FUNG|nr:hypothetical protein H4219_001076 [Mycoemilia scoparia]
MGNVVGLPKFNKNPENFRDQDVLSLAIKDVDDILNSARGSGIVPDQVELCREFMENVSKLGRDPENRDFLGESGCISSSVQGIKIYNSLYGSKDTEAYSAILKELLSVCLRVICNLCADNDKNRDRLLEADGIPATIELLTNTKLDQNSFLLFKIALVAIYNASNNYEPVAKALVGASAVKQLMRLFEYSGDNQMDGDLDMARLISSRSLDNLYEQDGFVNFFEEHPQYFTATVDFLENIEQRINQEDLPEVFDSLTQILYYLTEKSAISLFRLIQAAYSMDYSPLDDDEDSENENSNPSRNLHKLNKKNAWRDRKVAQITQTLSSISGSERALSEFFGAPELMKTLIDYINIDLPKEKKVGDLVVISESLHTAAMLCLGNLARTEKHCRDMVENFGDVLQALIDKWLSSNNTLVTPQTHHAITGFFKNLCIPIENRDSLVDMGLHNSAILWINSSVVPLQVNCLSILKLLTAQGTHAFDVVLKIIGINEVLGSPTPLSKTQAESTTAPPIKLLVDAIIKSDIPAVRGEGSRALVNIIARTFINMSANPKQNAELQSRAVAAITKGNGGSSYPMVQAMVLTLVQDGQRHPILLHESLKALLILSAIDPARCSYSIEIVEQLLQSLGPQKEGQDNEDAASTKTLLAVLESIIKDVKHETYPDQTFQQAVSLVRILFDTHIPSAGPKFTEGKEALKDRLAHLLPAAEA